MDWSDMIFQSWNGIVRTLIVGALVSTTLLNGPGRTFTVEVAGVIKSRH
jgi:hypothetical protein